MIFLDTNIISYYFNADIFIAAIVIKNNGTLVSNNTKHYEDIEQLSLMNWL